LSDLYLNPGESLILTTNRISVNFIPFDLMLTSLRLILLDNDHNRFSPQVIPIGDIFSVNGGSISTGEPIIRITVTDHDGDGSLIPLDFIFSQGPNQKRKQERDEWLRTLMEKLVAVRQERVLSGIQPADEDEEERPPVRRWIAPEILHPVPLDVAPDIAGTDSGSIPGTSGPLVSPEEISGEPGSAHRVASEFEGPPAPAANEGATDSSDPSETPVEITTFGESGPVPEETSSIPEKITGRTDVPVPRAQITEIPYEAVQPVQEPGDAGENDTGSSTSRVSPAVEPDEPRQLTGEEPVDELSRVSAVGLPEGSNVASRHETGADHSGRERYPPPASAAKPALPSVNWPVLRKPPVSPASGPRIPDTANAVGIPFSPVEAKENVIPAITVLPDEESGETRATREPGDEELPNPEVPTPLAPSEEQSPGELEAEPSGIAPPFAVAGTGSNVPRRRPVLLVAIVVIVGIVLAIAGLGFLYLHNLPDTTNTQVPPITLVATPNITTTVTPSPIPNVGVWVHVVYPQYYYGRVGNPGEVQDIGGTGDQFYFIRNSGSLVQADIQKRDNSGDVLSVEVYDNGTRVFNNSVRSPMGAIHILIDPETGKPPVPGS
jgi:hypothetical protein